jgi:hypothetical protein
MLLPPGKGADLSEDVQRVEGRGGTSPPRLTLREVRADGVAYRAQRERPAHTSIVPP